MYRKIENKRLFSGPNKRLFSGPNKRLFSEPECNSICNDHDNFRQPSESEIVGEYSDAQNIVCNEENVDNTKSMYSTEITDASTNGNRCVDCGITFSKTSNLKRHIGRKHPDKIASFVPPSKVKAFKCNLCKKSFSKTYLAVHQRKEHGVCAMKMLTCPLCKGTFCKSDLLKHLTSHHDVIMETEKLSFQSYDQFMSWKISMEDESLCHYKKHASQKKSKNITHYFVCHRSGNYLSRGKGTRHLKVQGSKKINAFCPASIKVEMKGDKCLVTIQKTHVGHSADLCHLSLTYKERQVLAAKIAAKLPFEAILDDVRDSVSNNRLQRRYLLTRKDLHNIACSFNLSSEFMRSSNDAESVDLWVKEVKENDTTSCILAYKPQGEISSEYPGLKAEDFLLIIMNDAQSEILKQYGSDCVCIDATHGLNYNLQLTTLIVLDNLRQGFPCCLLISNRIDEALMSILFSAVKCRVGQLQSSVFMSDMADSFYNAWTKIMGPAKNRLYCTWHVDRAWRNNLKKIKPREKQAEVYKLLRILLQEQDENAFSKLFKRINSRISADPETSDFAKYFLATYGHNTTSWAFCHRLHTGLNTNMHIERMHKTIKYIYFKGKNVKRLDKSIHALMKFIRDRMFDRLVVLTKGKISTKMQDLRKRHKNSSEMKSEIVCKEDEYIVLSSSKKELYSVKINKENCKCQLVCTVCKCCIHRYICSCPDSSVKWNMCKHIHFVCSFLSKNRDIEDNFPLDEELQIFENNELDAIANEVASKNLPVSHAAVNDIKNDIREKFNQLLAAASTKEELKLFSNTVEMLESKVMAGRQQNQIAKEFAGLHASSTTDKTPANKNIAQQRRFCSTKKKRKAPSISVTKPTTQERNDISVSLLLDNN